MKFPSGFCLFLIGNQYFMSFQSGPSKHSFWPGFNNSFEIYVIVFLQIPAEEFTVFMISQDVDDLSHNKPDSTTKQFRGEHQEHIYLMYLCSHPLWYRTLRDWALQLWCIQVQNDVYCKGMLHQCTHHQLEMLFWSGLFNFCCICGAALPRSTQISAKICVIFLLLCKERRAKMTSSTEVCIHIRPIINAACL